MLHTSQFIHQSAMHLARKYGLGVVEGPGARIVGGCISRGSMDCEQKTTKCDLAPFLMHLARKYGLGVGAAQRVAALNGCISRGSMDWEPATLKS